MNYLEKIYSNSGTQGVKAYVNQLERMIASKDIDIPDEIQLAHLRRVSPANYVCSQIRAENVGKLRFQVFDGEKPIAEGHPLHDLFVNAKLDFVDVMKRSEIGLSYFGYNLLYKLRDRDDIPFKLQWVNPTIYDIDKHQKHGIVRWIVRGDTDRRKWSRNLDKIIYPHDAVWANEIDLLDDYDGLAPAEVAYITAMIGYEVDTTELATFRNGAVPPLLFMPAIEQYKGARVAENAIRKLMTELRRRIQGSQNAGSNFGVMERYDVKELRSAFKDLQLSHLDEKVWITTAGIYRIPPSMVVPHLISSGLSRKEDERNWAESWLIPRGEWYASHFTEQFAKDYKSTIRIELDRESVPFLSEDENQKLETIQLKSRTGGITYATMQEEMGVEPIQEMKNHIWYEGVGWVDKKDAPDIWRYVLGVAPSATNTDIILGDRMPEGATERDLIETQAQATQQQATAQIMQINQEREQAQAEIEIEKEKVDIEEEKVDKEDNQKGKSFKGSKDLFASFSLAKDPVLTDYVERLRERFTHPDIEWSPADQWHVTLAYSPSANKDHEQTIIDEMGQGIEFPIMTTHSLSTFPEKDGKVPLILLLVRDDKLRSAQESVYNAFRQAPIPMSPYSKPEDWNGHVTLAYMPAKLLDRFEDEGATLALEAQRFVIQRDNYRTVFEIQNSELFKYHASAKQELKNWKRKRRKEGKSIEFDFEYLPQHVIRFVENFDKGDGLLLGSKSIELAKLGATDEDTALYEGAKALLRQKAIQATRLNFEGDIENLLTRARERNMPSRVLNDRFRSIVAHYIRLAYEDGLIDGGVADGSMSEDDLATIRQLTLDATPLIRRLVRALLDGDGITDGDIRNKPSHWFAGTINPSYASGLDSAGYNPMQEWVINRSKDNCRTCLHLNGQRHRRSIYRRNNLHNPPRVGQDTECGGHHCGCRLRNVRGRARGRIKMLTLDYAENHTVMDGIGVLWAKS